MEDLPRTESQTNGGEAPRRDPIVDRAASTAHDAVDRVADRIGPAVGRIRSVASDTAGTVTAKAGDVGTMGDELMESARSYVRERPLAALGVAVLAGIVISRLVLAP
jgi:ElaB/YqjD/DUF883 family membrane-anchored ribosome-binding protein